MPGLDKTRFVGLDQKLRDEFTCGICDHIFNQPMVATCCGQTFCDDCIRQWLAENNVCPIDKTSALTLSDIYPAPNTLKNILNEFQIRCEYSANGCSHVCAVEGLAAHMKDECAFNPSRYCTDCGGVKDEKSTHNCIKTLCEISKSTSQLVRDVPSTVAEMAKQMDRQREQYDSAVTKLESLIQMLQMNETALKTRFDVLSGTLNTVLAKVSTLEEENRYSQSVVEVADSAVTENCDNGSENESDNEFDQFVVNSLHD